MIKERFMHLYIIPYRQIIVTVFLIEFKSNVEIPFLSIWKNIRCFKPILKVYCLLWAEEQYFRLHVSKLFCTYSALLATEPHFVFHITHEEVWNQMLDSTAILDWAKFASVSGSFGKVTGLFLHLVNVFIVNTEIRPTLKTHRQVSGRLTSRKLTLEPIRF